MDPGPSGLIQLQEITQRVLNLMVSLAFLGFTVMLLYAGIKFILSSGDAKSIQSAWQTATWSMIGIGFLILSWTIIVAIRTFTSTDITNFCIGFAPNCL